MLVKKYRDYLDYKIRYVLTQRELFLSPVDISVNQKDGVLINLFDQRQIKR